MKKIKLDCFVTDDFCQITSSDKFIGIDNPLEKEVSLEIFNHKTTNCKVKIKTANFSTNQDSIFVKLMISDAKQIFFKDNLQIFQETEISLGSILPNSSVSYLFSIDLMNLILEEKKIMFDFDLVFDFTCEEVFEKTEQIQPKTVINNQFRETKVLSANDAIKENTNSFFLLLSILFVMIFFVIMKFIHEQKKKKYKKTMV